MQAAPAKLGKALDTDTPISDFVLDEISRQGYLGVGRYVPLPGNDASRDCSRNEATNITNRGLGLWLVQHVRMPGWSPGQHSGGADGLHAAQWAASIDYQAEAHIFLDLEGIEPYTPHVAVATEQYAVAWAASVRQLGFSAGLYVGYDVPLSPRELYMLHGFDAYWSDPGPRSVITRGFCCVQGRQVKIAGVSFDEDTIQLDKLGCVFAWVEKNESQVE